MQNKRCQGEAVVIVLVLLVILVLVIVLGGIGTCIMSPYQYDRDVRQYLKLADDASDAKTKLSHLGEYRDAITAKIGRNDARYIFTEKQYTRDAQLAILDTLISRLRDISQMDPKSFEYQTAMQQVTGQEFDHTCSRIDGIFWDCYRRSSGWRWLWTVGPMGDGSKSD